MSSHQYFFKYVVYLRLFLFEHILQVLALFRGSLWFSYTLGIYIVAFSPRLYQLIPTIAEKIKELYWNTLLLRIPCSSERFNLLQKSIVLVWFYGTQEDIDTRCLLISCNLLYGYIYSCESHFAVTGIVVSEMEWKEKNTPKCYLQSYRCFPFSLYLTYHNLRSTRERRILFDSVYRISIRWGQNKCLYAVIYICWICNNTNFSCHMVWNSRNNQWILWIVHFSIVFHVCSYDENLNKHLEFITIL